MKEAKQEKPPKKGFWHWIHQVFQNNRDLDSTGLLIIVGGGAILNQLLCAFVTGYAATPIAQEITKLYDSAITAMVLYFFMKGKSADNGGMKS